MNSSIPNFPRDFTIFVWWENILWSGGIPWNFTWWTWLFMSSFSMKVFNCKDCPCMVLHWSKRLHNVWTCDVGRAPSLLISFSQVRHFDFACVFVCLFVLIQMSNQTCSTEIILAILQHDRFLLWLHIQCLSHLLSFSAKYTKWMPEEVKHTMK